MQYGFTSGSCAAAAAKAAVYMLLSGRRKTEITIETPKGIPYHAKVEHIKIQETEVSCAAPAEAAPAETCPPTNTADIAATARNPAFFPVNI